MLSSPYPSPALRRVGALLAALATASLAAAAPQLTLASAPFDRLHKQGCLVESHTARTG